MQAQAHSIRNIQPNGGLELMHEIATVYSVHTHLVCRISLYSVFDSAVCRATTLVEGRTMNLICHHSDECFVCAYFFFRSTCPFILMHASLRFNTINDFASLWYFWWFHFEWDSVNRNEMY